MAFDYNIVAIRWKGGNYDVVAGQIFNQGLDWAALTKAFPLYDVSDDQTSYIDRATLLPVHRFREFVTEEKVMSWLNAEAREAVFILIHAAEWESGMGD